MFWADRVNEDRICLLALEGRVSRTDLTNLSMRIRGLVAQGVSQIVIDARAAEHWDFRGLGAVADAVAAGRGAGAHVAFITPSRYLRDIAGAVGLGGAFDFYDELELAGAPPVRLKLVEPAVPSEVRPLRRVVGP